MPYQKEHVSIRNRIQKYKPKKVLSNKKKVGEFVIDKTLLKVDSNLVWL